MTTTLLLHYYITTTLYDNSTYNLGYKRMRIHAPRNIFSSDWIFLSGCWNKHIVRIMGADVAYVDINLHSYLLLVFHVHSRCVDYGSSNSPPLSAVFWTIMFLRIFYPTASLVSLTNLLSFQLLRQATDSSE